MDKLPQYSIDLIDAMAADIPVKLPALNDPERQIWFDIGRRSVVDWLLELKRQAEETALNGEK